MDSMTHEHAITLHRDMCACGIDCSQCASRFALIWLKMPLFGLCALGNCGLACCRRHGKQHCAPSAGEKSVPFAARLVNKVLF